MRPKQLLSEKVQLEPFQIKTINVGFIERHIDSFSIVARYTRRFQDKGFYVEFQCEDQSLLLKVKFPYKDLITGRFVTKERIIENDSNAYLKVLLFSEYAVEFDMDILAV